MKTVGYWSVFEGRETLLLKYVVADHAVEHDFFEEGTWTMPSRHRLVYLGHDREPFRLRDGEKVIRRVEVRP